jgi:hypothetical protein
MLAVLAAQPIQHYADLVFGRVVSLGCPRMYFTTRSAGAFTDDLSRRIWYPFSLLRHNDDAPALPK